MIYVTQLIYIHPGAEAVFHAFEEVAIPGISRYDGELLLRIRPGTEAFIDGTAEQPYEIHLVAFKTEDDLRAFMQDEERRQFLHLKEQSVRSILMVKGVAL